MPVSADAGRTTADGLNADRALASRRDLRARSVARGVLKWTAVHVARPGPTPIRDTAAQDRPLARPGRRRLLRWGGAGLIALLVIAAGLFAARRWLGSERSVEGTRLRIAEVTRGTLVRDAAVTGRVVAAVSPTLYAPVPGTITLAIRAGDTVRRGDVLATIESPELQSELARERSALEELEAQLGGARIASEQARVAARREADEAAIALTAAIRELQSAERAREVGAIPEVEYQRALDAVETARIRDRNAKSVAALAGKSAGFDVKTAEKQHERQRLALENLERRVEELTVRAPVDGVVGTLSVADRAVVAAGTPLMTLVDLGQLEVELAVPETYADDLGIGMAAEIKIGGAVAPGRLAAMSPEVVDGHVLARVRFDGEQPAGLRQSQRVSARILIDERPDAIMVPRGPFLEAHGGRHIYVVEDRLAVRRAIRIGVTSVAAVEILEGLAPGERVVIAGSEELGEAGAVRIID